MIKELALRNRSYRRFKENHKISEAALKGLVDIARISASAANLQPLKYIISHTPETNAKIFPCLVWAGYLKDWAGPEEGERPSAYIVVLGDTSITKNFHCDHGKRWASPPRSPSSRRPRETYATGAMTRTFTTCQRGRLRR
jgi:nitroreductase